MSSQSTSEFRKRRKNEAFSLAQSKRLWEMTKIQRQMRKSKEDIKSGVTRIKSPHRQAAKLQDFHS